MKIWYAQIPFQNKLGHGWYKVEVRLDNSKKDGTELIERLEWEVIDAELDEENPQLPSILTVMKLKQLGIDPEEEIQTKDFFPYFLLEELANSDDPNEHDLLAEAVAENPEKFNIEKWLHKFNPTDKGAEIFVQEMTDIAYYFNEAMQIYFWATNQPKQIRINALLGTIEVLRRNIDEKMSDRIERNDVRDLMDEIIETANTERDALIDTIKNYHWLRNFPSEIEFVADTLVELLRHYSSRNDEHTQEKIENALLALEPYLYEAFDKPNQTEQNKRKIETHLNTIGEIYYYRALYES